MDKIREALELGKSYVSQVLQDHDLKYDHHPATEADRAAIVDDILCFDEALTLLSSPVAGDARELAESLWDLVHMAGGPMTEECAMSEAAARAEIEQLREALTRLLSLASAWAAHYAKANRLKSIHPEHEEIISKARAALAPSAPGPRESAEPAEEPENVLEIVRGWLKEHGYDGLCRDECGCGLDDLAPCDCAPYGDCKPAYKKPCTNCGQCDCGIGDDCYTTKKPAPEEGREGPEVGDVV